MTPRGESRCGRHAARRGAADALRSGRSSGNVDAVHHRRARGTSTVPPSATQVRERAPLAIAAGQSPTAEQAARKAQWQTEPGVASRSPRGALTDGMGLALASRRAPQPGAGAHRPQRFIRLSM